MRKLCKLMLLFQITYIQCIRLYSVGQFYPTEGESNPVTSESKTSGPIRDVIKRNSPRYRKVLIRNTNNEVLFDNEDARYKGLEITSELSKHGPTKLITMKRCLYIMKVCISLPYHIYDRCSPYIDTGQLICCANQLTGFYLNGIFVVKGLLIRTHREIFPHRTDTQNFQIISGNYSLICQLCTKPAMMTDT